MTSILNVDSIQNANGIKIGGTAAANLLDDFQQGTWDCRPSTSTSSVSLLAGWTINAGGTGYYVKVGRLVTCNFYFGWSNTTSSSGVLYMRLPFPCDVLSDLWGGNGIEASRVPFPSGVSYITCRPESAAQYATFKGCGSNINRVDMNFSNIGGTANGYMLGVFNYMTAS
jgi:hypothetical protein